MKHQLCSEKPSIQPTTALLPHPYKRSFVYRHFQEIALLLPRLLPTVRIPLTPPSRPTLGNNCIFVGALPAPLHVPLQQQQYAVALAHSCFNTHTHMDTHPQGSQCHQPYSQNNDLSLLPHATSSFAEKYSASKRKTSSSFDIWLPVFWNSFSHWSVLHV